MSIFPLYFTRVYKALRLKKNLKRLAISMTLLIYTHVLSVAMTMVMIIIALIIQFIGKEK